MQTRTLSLIMLISICMTLSAYCSVEQVLSGVLERGGLRNLGRSGKQGGHVEKPENETRGNGTESDHGSDWSRGNYTEHASEGNETLGDEDRG